jgi:hypothetical protein
MSLNSLDLAGDAGNSFPFDHIGASVTGKVAGMEEVQQTDMQSGEPAFWSNGQPKIMYRLDLQTDLGDGPDDDGKRSVYLKGSRKRDSGSSLAAVLEAVRSATGSTAIAVGGTLTLTYAADGEQTHRGYNPPKLYTAQYSAPSMELDAAQPAPVPPVQQAPAPAAQQVQTPVQPAQQPAAPALTPEVIAALQASGINIPGVA